MITPIQIVSLAPQHAAVVSADIGHDEIAAFIGHAFGDVLEMLHEQGLAPTGMPFARYAMHDDGFHVDAGFPCDEGLTESPVVRSIELPAGTAAQTTHIGSYAALGEAYRAIEEWMSANGFIPAGGPWESYLDGPDVAEPRTVITWPCNRG